jgi:Zn-dependent protease with chaperone function
MLLWQSMALAAVLAGLGASLAVATDSALAPSRPAARWVVVGFALAVGIVVAGRLAYTGHRVGRRLRLLRRRHRDLVDVLIADDAGVRVFHHEAPMAYCLPGWHSRVVLSDSVIAALDAEEVQAVLAHERAHLRARHDLVLEAFTVLYEAFPRWVSSRSALSEVRMLVEVLADRAAARRVGSCPLARALVCLAGSNAPAAGLGAGGSSALVRIKLLADRSSHRLLASATTVAAVLVLALPTFFVALPWLRGVSAGL